MSGLLLLALVGLTLYDCRSHRQDALAQYRALLQASGEKLTYADLGRERSTNGGPSLALLVTAAAKTRGQPLTPGTLPLRWYSSPGRAQVAWRQTNPWLGPGDGPNPAWNWEAFARQVETLQGPIQELRAALKDPAPDSGPRTNLLFGPRIDFVSMRTAAQWLMGAAMSEVRQDRLEAASLDLAALAALGKVDRREYSLVAQMIRVAITRLASVAIWEALQAPGWTDAQLARMQGGVEGDDLLGGLEKGLMGSRISGLEYATLLHKNPATARGLSLSSVAPTPAVPNLASVFEDGVLLPIYHLTSAEADELLYLQQTQSSLDRVRSLRAGERWTTVKAQMTPPTTRKSPISAGFQQLTRRLSWDNQPNFIRATETAIKGETERQMTLAALALTRYQLRHGRLPETLAALIPEFLAVAPGDPMGGNSLSYRPRPNGTFLLYSIGLDGRDDGGDPRPGPGGKPGFWEGLDAVWPDPVESKGEGY